MKTFYANNQIRMGLLYFIQPLEFLNTNVYKIGMSRDSELVRCRTGYKRGTRYIAIMECLDAVNVEKILIKTFLSLSIEYMKIKFYI